MSPTGILATELELAVKAAHRVDAVAVEFEASDLHTTLFRVGACTPSSRPLFLVLAPRLCPFSACNLNFDGLQMNLRKGSLGRQRVESPRIERSWGWSGFFTRRRGAAENSIGIGRRARVIASSVLRFLGESPSFGLRFRMKSRARLRLAFPCPCPCPCPSRAHILRGDHRFRMARRRIRGISKRIS